MNSGAPASMAPPDFSSLGMMVSQSDVSVSYWWGGKYFGVYFPGGGGFFLVHGLVGVFGGLRGDDSAVRSRRQR